MMIHELTETWSKLNTPFFLSEDMVNEFWLLKEMGYVVSSNINWGGAITIKEGWRRLSKQVMEEKIC